MTSTGTVYAWVDSFLLPEPSKSELAWTGNLKAAVDEARTAADRKLLEPVPVDVAPDMVRLAGGS